MNTVLDKLTPMQKSAYVLKKLRAKLDKIEKKQSEPIAIIGMSCRFPGASDCNEYWQLLHNGKDAVTEIPEDRWPINDFYNPDPSAPGKMNTRCGGFVSNIDMFDADFFGISLREAKKMDPQHRMLLEVSWEALENAGLSPQKLIESQTGVFIGFNQTDYSLMHLKGDYKNFDQYTTTANGYCFGAGRIAYTFGFSGPVMSIDTACSSSMVALHQACNAIRANDCNMALAGGVQLNILPHFHIMLSQIHTLSPSGACRTFDADADGLVLGEGCGLVVLKRLSDALLNNDNILALILGTSVNHGGPASGITVPNEMAQENVIRQALKNARKTPSDIHFIETHGSGTTLGDPIEFNSIDAIFGDRPINDPLILGSVKTNIGHLDAASGIAGLIKTVLSIQNNEIPPNLHFKTPSPKIDWSKDNIKVASEIIPWPRTEQQRIAGVSSFGISGTNSHAVIEEPPEPPELKKNEVFKRPVHVFTLSAKTEKALHDLVKAYCDYLNANPHEKIENICYTANTGRDHFNCRLAVITHSILQLHEKLTAYLNGTDADGLLSNDQPTRQLKVTFYFPEENKKIINYGKHLYQTQPQFKKGIDLCHTSIQDAYNISLHSILTNTTDHLPVNHIQLANLSIAFALSKLWQSLGINPSNVMGHGVGNIAAACIAGKYSLEQAVQTILNESLPDNDSDPHIKIISGNKSNFEYIQTIKDHQSKYIIKMGLESTVTNDQLNGVNYLSAFEKNCDEWTTLVNHLSFLYTEGADINWESFDSQYFRKRVQLPSYPFQRKKYWIDKEAIAPISDQKNFSLFEQKVFKQSVTAQSENKQSKNIKTLSRQDNKSNTELSQIRDQQLKIASDPIATNQSSTELSRIMAQQLKLASDSITTVVSQQLNFLSNRRIQKIPKDKSIIKEVTTNNTKNEQAIDKKKNIQIATDTKKDQPCTDKIITEPKGTRNDSTIHKTTNNCDGAWFNCIRLFLGKR